MARNTAIIYDHGQGSLGTTAREPSRRDMQKIEVARIPSSSLEDDTLTAQESNEVDISNSQKGERLSSQMQTRTNSIYASSLPPTVPVFSSQITLNGDFPVDLSRPQFTRGANFAPKFDPR